MQINFTHKQSLGSYFMYLWKIKSCSGENMISRKLKILNNEQVFQRYITFKVIVF